MGTDLGVVLEGCEGEVVDIEPDGGAPVGRIVLRVVLVVQRARLTQRAQPGLRPQLGRVAQLRQYGAQLAAVPRQRAQQQREQAHIPARTLTSSYMVRDPHIEFWPIPSISSPKQLA